MESLSQAASGSLGRRRLLNVLLMCGVTAAGLYIAADIFAATTYPGYSYVDQQQSELSAIGAPTRFFWIWMVSVYTPLMIAFGLGVWLSAGAKRSLRAAGALLAAFGIIGYLWVLFAPMNPVGQARTATDIMHLVFLVVQIFVMVLFMSFGAVALGRGFRRFSILMIVVMLAAGGVVGTRAEAIAAGHSPPWLGLVERMSIYAPMIWIIAFAVIILGAIRPVTRKHE
jgi:hypothetical protein